MTKERQKSIMRVEMKLTAFVTVILALLPCHGISARPTTAYEAEAVVSGWLMKQAQPLGVALGHQIANVDTFADSAGNAVYYIVYLKPSGFVVVSADDLIEPIIGFSDDGTYDPSLENPLGALVRSDLSNRTLDAQAAFGLMSLSENPAQIKAQTKWHTYVDLAQNSNDGFMLMGLACLCDIRVVPLVQSRWSQADVCGKTCYNYYTPNNYPSGCLATAMAQLMRYFQYPTAGIGKMNFSISVDSQIQYSSTLGGDELGGPYKWNQMVLNPSANCGSLTTAQCKAIGSLCYDAGIAVKMDYAQSGSGAGMQDAQVALKETFGYSNAVLGYNYERNIDSANLYSMINPCLDAGLPVILGIFAGEQSQSGHAVLCDGYAYDTSIKYTRDGNSYEASTIYHHVNMGWNGTDDAWYNLPDINAQQAYDTITACLYNISPSQVGEIISGRVLDPNNNPIMNAVVFTKAGRTVQFSTMTDYRGIYAFEGLNSNTSYTLWANIDGRVTEERTILTNLSVNGSPSSGNIWGVDFYADTEPNSIPLSLWYVDDDAPNDPAPYNSALSDPNEDGSPEHPFDSIQEAINASTHGDKVVILRGTYSGTGNRDIDFKGKAITVTGEDPNDPNLVTIDCDGTVSQPHYGFVFQNYEIPKSVLSGVTITRGYSEKAGAIYLTNCVRPVITNCVFLSNSANVGGAIYCNNSSPVISDCLFEGNHANAGGAIYNNSAASGSTPVTTNCNFYNNTSVYNGGAIYNNGPVSPTFKKCTFESNYSSGGGAIRNNLTENLTVANCIFTTNTADTFGGAIRNSNAGDIKVTNCTFFANVAQSGKSFACTADDEGGHLAGSLQIRNCIIVDGGGEIFNGDDSTINVTYSCLEDTETEAPWPGDGNIYVDPLFADAADADFHLKSQAGRYDPNSLSWVADEATSPCIDAGDPQDSTGKEPKPNGGVINMGAYGGTEQASKTYSY